MQGCLPRVRATLPSFTGGTRTADRGSPKEPFGTKFEGHCGRRDLESRMVFNYHTHCKIHYFTHRNAQCLAFSMSTNLITSQSRNKSTKLDSSTAVCEAGNLRQPARYWCSFVVVEKDTRDGLFGSIRASSRVPSNRMAIKRGRAGGSAGGREGRHEAAEVWRLGGTEVRRQRRSMEV